MNKLFAVLITMLLAVTAAQADSLFVQPATTPNTSGTLIAEQTTRFQPGDIISVLVRESIDASTAANTNTKKESQVQTEANANENSFFVTPKDEGGLGIIKPGELPNIAGETENETKNRGSTTRETTLTTTVACQVVQVLPNGNLMIAGERKLTVNREDSTLVVSGLIRAKDVSAQNTIPSTQMANAQIQLKGKGDLWNNQRRGILTRVADWVNPF